jgi:hypothetical protein
MYSAPKHSAARHGHVARSHRARNRIAGLTLAASATFVTMTSLSPPAQATPSVWDRVAACESGGNWSINTGNGYYGGLQFSAQTWRGFGGTFYAPSANRAGKAAQIAIARRVLAAQGPRAWSVCSARAGLTRANGGGAVAVSRAVPVSRSATRVSVGRLVVDGRMGPMTIRSIQRWVGTAQNGVFGVTTVKALQRRTGVRADGAIGPQTIRALQVKIGARRDGARSLNPATVAALQRYLNGH